MNTNNNKATHYGTCQYCGSLQKADRHTNRLANHGYTLAYGWQAGTCEGSNRLPFEVSKDYAEAVLQKCLLAIAAFVETPRPERTVASWHECPAIIEWQLAQQAQSSRKQYAAWATARLANWAPRAQQEVRELEAVEAAAKATRTGIRALSGAEKLAKRDLSRFGDTFCGILDDALNRHLYADRNAYYAAATARGDLTSTWPRWKEIVEVSLFATNRVAKLLKLARETGDAEVLAGADRLEKLAATYEAAKAAHQAAKA
jgi:hypothetical protein